MTYNNEDFPKLVFNYKTNKISLYYKCPQCENKYLHGVPYVNISCTKCGINSKTDFSQTMYQKKSYLVHQLLAYHNGLHIIATNEFESDVAAIKNHYDRYGCWDVGDIITKKETYKKCKQCGICNNCLTCTKCDEKIMPDKNKRKAKCPKCNKSELTKTHFKKVETHPKNRNIKMCPHCKSEKINFTRINDNKKCYMCGSKETSREIECNLFILTIKRKKAYLIENIAKE